MRIGVNLHPFNQTRGRVRGDQAALPEGTKRAAAREKNSLCNDYRLIVAIAYRVGVAYIKFIGTHVRYDAVDAATVDMS